MKSDMPEAKLRELGEKLASGLAKLNMSDVTESTEKFYDQNNE